MQSYQEMSKEELLKEKKKEAGKTGCKTGSFF